MSSFVVQPGDVLLVPPRSSNTLKSTNIEWQQRLSNKKAEYHFGFVPVQRRPDAHVMFFIASEWYNEGGEVKVDDKVRYGEKNDSGQARFIVFHPTDRNPYQHRFLSSALRDGGLQLGQTMAKMFGITDMGAGHIADQINALVGDELRKF